MQAPDGRVYHKLSARHFSGFVMPEEHGAPRYFCPWSSGATAELAAMAAQAARCFAPYDPEFAARCLEAARRSHAFLQAHPEQHRADQSAFSTGTYRTFDWGGRLWAAAELWETTGGEAFLRDFEGRARSAPEWRGRDVRFRGRSLHGVLTYLASERAGRDEALVAELREGLIAAADRIVATAHAHGYARPTTRYFWGCHGAVAGTALTLQAAHRLSPKPAYVETCLDGLNHLLGRNYFGRSFVTGLGHRPPMHPHDRRSGADGVEPPWPGYLVGGPERSPTDWRDVQFDYRTNEIAINWNGALLYALAGFVEPQEGPDE
jgi:endoglucanase